jgi:signal transduction histidine kinase
VGVTDRGPGINNVIRTRAFGVFEKFDPSGTKFAEGIGLGLPISRKLMEVHGGSIYFADNQDSGATVVLAFPAHRTVIWLSADLMAASRGARSRRLWYRR